MLEKLSVSISRIRFRISSKSRERLWQRICSLSRSGVPIAEAMEFLHESRTHGGVTAGFIEHQRIAIRAGGFSAGAVGWVPKEELIIIEVTQEGDIAAGFAQAARIASVRSQLRSTLFSGLTYPTILLLVGGTVVAVLPGFALNVMVDLVDPSRWPPVSRSVLTFSELMSNWGDGNRCRSRCTDWPPRYGRPRAGAVRSDRSSTGILRSLCIAGLPVRKFFQPGWHSCNPAFKESVRSHSWKPDCRSIWHRMCARCVPDCIEAILSKPPSTQDCSQQRRWMICESTNVRAISANMPSASPRKIFPARWKNLKRRQKLFPQCCWSQLVPSQSGYTSASPA